MGLLQLEKKYSAAQIEAACSKTLSFSKTPSLKSIRLALRSTAAASQPAANREQEMDNSASGFRRGSEYFGGRTND